MDHYETTIVDWLKEHPDLSVAQVEDWLLEEYPKLDIGSSTVRSFVTDLRDRYALLKQKQVRQYEAIPEVEMGEQIQVDWGETWQETMTNEKVKLYFICFVLGHNRYKYVEWLDRPFKTTDAIRCHEQAFISSVANKRNNIPRKSLDYQTPLEVFMSYMNEDILSSLI